MIVLPMRILLILLLLRAFFNPVFSQNNLHKVPPSAELASFQPQKDRIRLLVKFSHQFIRDIEGSRIYFRQGFQPASADLAFLSSFRYTQVIPYSADEKRQMREGAEMQPRGKNRFNAYNFRGMAYVEAANVPVFDELSRIKVRFEQLPFVEYAEIENEDPAPPPSQTPDFSNSQHYRSGYLGGNIIGINMEYAWAKGIKGRGVKIADIEWSYDFEHEDLRSDSFVRVIPSNDTVHKSHGSAVAGIMYARNNSFGMTGMVHEADAFYGISELPRGRPGGIVAGIDSLHEGDVFLYEMQVGGRDGRYVPADFNKAVWDLTKSATEAGIIIVAAAGNGNEYLDDPFYLEYNSRGDNGSIIVGAGTRTGRDRAGFSTHGSRVNLQGWGDWSVATCGYGQLFNGGPNALYTNQFSGTSSATPIVASAVVALQSYSKARYNYTLSPVEMRRLLIETGTPQGTGWSSNVPQPDIRAAMADLDKSINNLDLQAYPAEAGLVYGSGNYFAGNAVPVYARANDGWSFTGWSGDTVYLSNSTLDSALVEMPKMSVRLTANFTNRLKVFPNPAFNRVEVQSDSEIDHISLYAITGQLLTDISNTGLKRYGLMLTDVCAGVYFLSISSGGKTKIEKLVISK